MLLNKIKPSSFLSEYIRLYRIIDFNFSTATKIPPKLYSPRPELCLQFYPKDTETVNYPNTDFTISDKRATCIGQHNIIQQRCVGREFLSVQVVFQPGALYRLTGIPVTEFTNQYLDAAEIFGTKVIEVTEQLYNAVSYRQMIAIVEAFLVQLKKTSKKNLHAVDTCSKMMLLQEDHFGLEKFLKEACLCHRQFDRKFHERTGIGPKQFLRIIRFDKAYRMKNKFPKLDWLSIAVRCGYYDYQHLAKDYKEFTGYTPPQFYEIDNAAPERAFGDAEV